MLKKNLFFGCSYIWNLQYPWGTIYTFYTSLYFWRARENVTFCGLLSCYSFFPLLLCFWEKAVVILVVWTPPTLSDDFIPWSKYLVWSPQFSCHEPLNLSRLLYISYSTSSLFQKKLYLYLLSRLISLPLFCIFLWNFTLLIISSLNYIFCVFSSVDFFPSEYTPVASTTKRNTQPLDLNSFSSLYFLRSLPCFFNFPPLCFFYYVYN